MSSKPRSPMSLAKATNGKHAAITSRIIKGFYVVYYNLGYGFLEKVYKNAMTIELRGLSLNVVAQAPIHVFYRTQTADRP
jgi:GxxExxY protein